MGKHQASFDSQRLLRVLLEGDFTHEQWLTMLQDVHNHLERARQAVAILVIRKNFGFPPTAGQVEAGLVLRHPKLTRIASIGPPLFGGAVSDLIAKRSGKRVHYFETEPEAIAYLLAPPEST